MGIGNGKWNISKFSSIIYLTSSGPFNSNSQAFKGLWRLKAQVVSVSHQDSAFIICTMQHQIQSFNISIFVFNL